ncbi:MAG TPA: hypothetical protein VF552_08340 [Allosphingosinicella sp.]|jgi:hypothetical protein
MTQDSNVTPAELGEEEIGAVAGGTGLVGPSGGRSDGGGGTIGSGT